MERNFDDLPLEVQHMIFSYLTQHELTLASTISPKWYKMAYDSIFWKSVKIDDDQSCAWTSEIPKSIRNTVLKIEIEKTITAPNMLLIVRNFPRVRELSIKFTNGRHRMSTFLETIDRMKTVTVQLVRWKFLKSLSIEMTDDPSIFVSCTNIIAKGCKRLEVFDGARGVVIGDYSIVTLVKRHGDTLRHLHIIATIFTDVSYGAIRKCSNLTSLHLREAYNLTDRGLRFLRKLSHLETLIVDQAVLTTVDGIVNFFRWADFPKLKILRLKILRFSNAAAAWLCKNCPALEVLELKGIGGHFTDDGVNEIIKSCTLKELIIKDAKKVTGDCLVEIQWCLMRLEFSNLPAINRDVLKELCQQKPCMNICLDGKRL